MQNIPSIFQEIIELPGKIKNSLITLESSHGDFYLGFIEEMTHKLTWMMKLQKQTNWILQKETPEDKMKAMIQLPLMEKVVSLFDNKADFHIFFTKRQSDGPSSLWMASSHNYGRTWKDIIQLSDEIQEWNVFSSPIIIQNGLYVNRFVVPYIDQGTQRSAFLISQDNGKTWGTSLFLEPHEEAGMLEDELTGGTLHPTIIENLDGHLRAFFHVINWPKLYSATSADLGETWSESNHIEQIDIDPSKPYDIIKLMDKDGSLTIGVLLCGWNLNSSMNTSNPKSERDLLGELKLYLSNDEGITFESIKTLYSGPYRANSICHLIQDSNYEIHIFYSLDHVKITHEMMDFTPILTTLVEEQKKIEKINKEEMSEDENSEDDNETDEI